jgi:predicted HTH domain antitoxin
MIKGIWNLTMGSILSFLKQKEKAESNGVAENSNIIETVIAFAQSKDISMAKAVEKLNSFQSFKVDELLEKITKSIKNINEEVAHKFQDGSILLNHAGRLSGLNQKESSLWEDGLYMKNDIQISNTDALSEILQIESEHTNRKQEIKSSVGVRITL